MRLPTTTISSSPLNENDVPPLADGQQGAAMCAANLIGARIFYDFCRDRNWVELVRERIQHKLSAVHVSGSGNVHMYVCDMQLPYYIDQLTLTKLDPGRTSPCVKHIGAPYVDDWGVWIDVDVLYEGCVRLVIETKIDLIKLKREARDGDSDNDDAANGVRAQTMV
jgi:hypothetical protein